MSSKYIPQKVIDNSNVLLYCQEGDCATNLFNGNKRCPEDDSPLGYHPGYEVCNKPFSCNNTITPFALQSDGSTNNYGICEDNTQCPCFRERRCPNYISSIFKNENGNPYTDISQQHIVFQQYSVNTYPVKYTDNNTFCSIPYSWLSNANPGCKNIDPLNYDEGSLIQCMDLAKGCSSSNVINPCLEGTLAIIDNTSNNIILACIRSSSNCPCGYLALYDKDMNQISCQKQSS